MAQFSQIFKDDTRLGYKIPASEYLTSGKYPIIDQGKHLISGYRNEKNGLYSDIPVIIFGDHTRILKYINTPFFIGADGVKILKPKINDCNYKYLYYVLCNIKIPNTGYNRHFKWIKEVNIDLPELNIQNKVVNTLDRINYLVLFRKQQLSKLDQLVKSRFIEMFGDPVENPHHWTISRLEHSIKFITSGSRGWSQYFSNDGEFFITIKNVKNSKIIFNEVQYIHPPKNAEAARTKVQEDDLLISITADLGRTGVVTKFIAEKGAYINQHLICIRLDKSRLLPLFVSYYLVCPAGKKQFSQKNQTGVKAGLNFDAIKSLQIFTPPLSLQEQFIAFVQQVDKAKSSVKQSLEKLETLKKSLMQEYFG